MEDANDFGSWLRRRRRQLDLTQRALADCAACSTVTIRKFEAGERRPSRELAELLSRCLGIPATHQDAFVAFARGINDSFAAGSVAPSRRDAATRTSGREAPTRNGRAPLPVAPTPFVGRAVELAQIATRLEDPDCRLLTLVGPGGMGKTRLALAAAEALRTHFADGAAFVSLAAVHGAAGLPQGIAHALDVSLSGSADAVAQLASYLHDKELLLVLDNFESVLDGADLLAGWLQQTPATKWLVTSRERLNLAEEWLLTVRGLNTPEAGMKLFAQIAERLQPDFSLAAHAPVVAQICAYVGGMPLAIELAAGWAATLSCEQILAQMQQTFDFLSTSLRNVPQRHRSLRQLFDQSWRLLHPREQQALMKLSVFLGGFAPEEAALVAGATAPLLHSLVGKALVLPDGRGRYALHELIRRYAAETLQASGNENATRQQHFQVYLALAEAFDLNRGGPEGIQWFERMETEHDNFIAALDWWAQTGAGEDGVRLANALWWFWFRRGYWRAAEKWLNIACAYEQTADTPQRCRALLYLSTIIALQGRYGDAAPYLMGAVAMARRLENRELLAGALTVLGQALPGAEEAIETFGEARELLEQGATPREMETLALLLNLIGERLQKMGRYLEAADNYRESLRLYRARGNVDLISYPLGNLGRLALQEGALVEAERLIIEAIDLSRAIGNLQGVADWLIPFGRLKLYQGEAAAAERHLREALSLHRAMSNRHGKAEALAGLALIALARSDIKAAELANRSLDIYIEISQQTQRADAAFSEVAETLAADLVDCLFVAGLATIAQHKFEPAAALFAIAERARQQIGYQLDPYLQQKVDKALAVMSAHGSAAIDGDAMHGQPVIALLRLTRAEMKKPFKRSLEGSEWWAIEDSNL